MKCKKHSDGRSIDHNSLQVMRQQAVKAVREGQTVQSERMGRSGTYGLPASTGLDGRSDSHASMGISIVIPAKFVRKKFCEYEKLQLVLAGDVANAVRYVPCWYLEKYWCAMCSCILAGDIRMYQFSKQVSNLLDFEFLNLRIQACLMGYGSCHVTNEKGNGVKPCNRANPYGNLQRVVKSCNENSRFLCTNAILYLTPILAPDTRDPDTRDDQAYNNRLPHSLQIIGKVVHPGCASATTRPRN